MSRPALLLLLLEQPVPRNKLLLPVLLPFLPRDVLDVVPSLFGHGPLFCSSSPGRHKKRRVQVECRTFELVGSDRYFELCNFCGTSISPHNYIFCVFY